MKKALVIYGGPRRHGNTENLLDEFIKGMGINNFDIDRINLSKCRISTCTACYGCSKNGVCIINDDMSEIYMKLKKCDLIILASPIYFGSVSSLTKIMIDRCQAFWSEKFLTGIKSSKSKKSGYFIATAGTNDERMFEGAKFTVKLFFTSCNALYSGDVFAGNTDSNPLEISSQILEKAYLSGRNIII